MIIKKAKTKLPNFFASYKTNFWKAFLLDISYLFFFVYCVSVPVFSYNNFHILSIAFLALFSFSSFLWLFFYSEIKITNFSYRLLAYILVITICSMLGRYAHWQQTYYLLPISCLIIYQFAITSSHWTTMIHLFFLSLFVFLFAFLFIYRTELLSHNFSRLGEWFGNVNTVYKPFALGSCLAFYYALFEKKYWHYLSAIIFAVTGLTTGSKGFLFFLIIGLLALAVIKNGRTRWWLDLVFGLFTLLGFLILINIPAFSFLRNRILDFLSPFGINFDGKIHYDGSTIERIYMMKESFEDFLMSPIFGWGMDSFQAMSNFPYAHNMFGELLVAFGLVGLVAYLLLLFPSFFLLVKHPSNRYFPFLIAVFISFFVTHLSSVLFNDKTFWMMMAFFASATYDSYLQSIKCPKVETMKVCI